MKKLCLTLIALLLGSNQVFALQATDIQLIPNAYYHAKYDGKDGIFIRDHNNIDELIFFDSTRLITNLSQQQIDYNKIDIGGLLFEGKGGNPGLYQFNVEDGKNTQLVFKRKEGFFRVYAFCYDRNIRIGNKCELIHYRYNMGQNGKMSGGGGGTLLSSNGKGGMYITKRWGDYIQVNLEIKKYDWITCKEKDTSCLTFAGGKQSESIETYIVNPVNGKVMNLGIGVDLQTVKVNPKTKTVSFKKYSKNNKGSYIVGAEIIRKL